MVVKKIFNLALGRRLILFSTLLLLLFGTTSLAFAFALPQHVSVGLYFSGTALTSCRLESEEGFLLGTVTEEGFSGTLPLPAYTVLIGTVEHHSLVLRDEDGVLISSDIGSRGCVMPADYETGGTLKIQEKEYRGGVIFKENSSDMLTVINYVLLEEYLYGVVHLEMSQSNPLEALKAQAVTARSFAAANLEKHSDLGFDLCNTTNCQVYGGCAAEYDSTNKAVDETAGLLIWSNKEPVAVYYHKNSGGHTQSIEDVWSYPQPHLIGVDDPHSPNYPWTATLTFDTIAQKLSQAGSDIGEVESLQITERNAAGAVSKLTIKGSKGTKVLEKEKIRTVFGTTLIRSRIFDFGSTYQGTALTVSLNLKGLTTQKAAGDTIYVMGASGKATALSKSSLYVSNGITKIASGEQANVNADTEIETSGTVVISGLGYGHGVGMSQDGAIQMAKDGFAFDDILEFYFTDIEIR